MNIEITFERPYTREPQAGELWVAKVFKSDTLLIRKLRSDWRVTDSEGTPTGRYDGTNYEWLYPLNQPEKVQPKTIGDLPEGCWCSVFSRLTLSDGSSYDVTLGGIIEYREKISRNTPIDEDEEGNPIIFGYSLLVKVTR